MMVAQITNAQEPEAPSAQWRLYYRLNVTIWLLIGCIFLVVWGGILSLNIHVRYDLIPLNLVEFTLFFSIFLFYFYLRKDPLIIVIFNSLSIIAAFVYSIELLSYVATVWGRLRPLADGELAAFDQFFGLDWPAYLRWMNDHPGLAQVLGAAYNSLPVQGLSMVLVLAAFRQHRRLQTMLLAVHITALLTVALAALMPALGAYHHYHIVAALDHPALELTVENKNVAQILNLRSAEPVLPVSQLDGIITFPSFHTVLALLFIWAFYPLPYFRLAAVAVNLALMCATPLWGSHYFADLAAGLCVAAAGLFISHIFVVFMQKQAHNQAFRACCFEVETHCERSFSPLKRGEGQDEGLGIIKMPLTPPSPRQRGEGDGSI